MRVLKSILLAGALLAPLAAAADPVATVALGPNETLLEVNGTAELVAPADSVMVSVNISGRGATVAAARQVRDRLAASVRSAATAAGAQDVAVTSYDQMYDDTMVMPIVTVPTAPPGATTPVMPPEPNERFASGTVNMTFADMQRLAAFARDLPAGARVTRREPRVAEDSPARVRVREMALAQARRQADQYATAMGLRVVRVVRVTERTGFNLADIPRMEGPARIRADRSPEGATLFAILGLDVILAPR